MATRQKFNQKHTQKTMHIKKISSKSKDVDALLLQSTEYIHQMYPAINYQLDGKKELSQANVYFVGAFDEKTLAGIGAVKILVADIPYGEIKRVFVSPQYRGKGVSKLIMRSLEIHLLANDINISRLETGVKQSEAIGLYLKLGYVTRPPFGAHLADPLSLFMEKVLKSP